MWLHSLIFDVVEFLLYEQTVIELSLLRLMDLGLLPVFDMTNNAAVTF